MQFGKSCKLSINCEEELENKCLCALNSFFEFMGSKWIPELITILGYHKSLRFGEFEIHLPGISSTVLTTKLDKLIEFDYVQRIEYDESPPRVEYHLNENGLNLWDKLQYLQDLAK